jgi:hypothetical protein
MKSAERHDKPVPTPPWYRGDLTVLGLFTDMKQAWDKASIRRLDEARRNELYVLGDWDAPADYYGLGRKDKDADHRNLMYPLAMTWAARLTRLRQRPRAVPADASAFDSAAVEVANKYIRHQFYRLELDALIAELVQLAQMHSVAAMRIAWNPEAGAWGQAVDEKDGVPLVYPDGRVALERQGAVQWDLISVFNYMIQPVEDFRDAKWCAFRDHIDKYAAKQALYEAGYDDEPATVKTRDLRGEEYECVEVWEMWHLPHGRVPGGLYALIIGGCVVDVRSWPYERVDVLPIAVFKSGKRRDSPFGKTHISDAVYQQANIDGVLSAAKTLRNECAKNVALFLPTEVADEWTNRESVIVKVTDPERGAIGRWLLGPLDAITDLRKEAYEEGMALHETFGMSDVSSGSADLKAGTAGKTVAYYEQLDAQKLAHPARNLHVAIRRAMQIDLALASEFISTERLAAIAGPGSEYEVFAFTGATLDGVDVILEPASGHDEMLESKREQVRSDAASGWEDPARAKEMQWTGVRDTQDEIQQRTQMEQIIKSVVAGNQMSADLSVSPQIATEMLRLAIETTPEPNANTRLRMLLLEYVTRGQQNQQQAQQQQQQAQPPSARPQTEESALLQGAGRFP